MKKSLASFFEETEKWNKEYAFLRKIILDTGLKEELKWGKPCYTFQEHNIVLMHGFKEYCALLFPKGVLLKDPKKILIQQTKNVQAARQIRFAGIAEIEALKKILKSYIYEAIEVEKAGVKIKMKKTDEFNMPEELKGAFAQNSDLKTAFEKLTPGRQRGYLLYFSGAKQQKTRIRRIEKYTSKILEGKGLND